MRINIFSLLFFFVIPSIASEVRISFVVPDREGPLFWSFLTDISHSVAKNLGVELEVIYSDSDRFASLAAINEIAARDNKPDYLIFRPFQGNVVEVFNILEKNNIKFVTLEQAFVGEEAISVGKPQQKYSHWLGQINYDNKSGGKLLTQALVKLHQQKYKDRRISITGIGGDFDAVSIDRQTYLDSQRHINTSYTVNQIFPMLWKPQLIEKRFSAVLKRYPTTNIFWCAGDQMALELIKQLSETTMPHAENIMIGGFDWLPEALEKIKSGEMAASVGGHFLMGASAVIRIIDYHQGVNRFIAGEELHQFELIDSYNVDEYLTFLNEKNWQKLDYHRYLKSYNKEKDIVELTVENMIKQNKSKQLNRKSHH